MGGHECVVFFMESMKHGMTQHGMHLKRKISLMKVLSKHEFSSLFTLFKILLMLKFFMFHEILNFLFFFGSSVIFKSLTRHKQTARAIPVPEVSVSIAV